jgi:hypothetical protein
VTARPSKPSGPKPSCPKGLSVTWDPATTGLWMCCKNSDCRGYCKRDDQAPFPYGPRRKLVCCQCPSGQVLNKDKNGCVSIGAPSQTYLPTYQPTPPPSDEPTTYPTPPTPHGPTPAPSSEPTVPPTHTPTAHPTQPPTPQGPTIMPTHIPTPSPTPALTRDGPTPAPSSEPTVPPTNTPTPAPTEEGTVEPPPPKPDCDPGYVVMSSSLPILAVAIATRTLKPGFRMCCLELVRPWKMNSPPNYWLFYEKNDGTGAPSTMQELGCYCIDGQTWNPESFSPIYAKGFCG